jgi:transcriptional antiterminator NusG
VQEELQPDNPEETGAAPEDAPAQDGVEAGEAEEAAAEEPSLIKEPPDDGIKRRWYAIHAHSGQEGTVQQSLLARAEQAGLEAQITNVLVPMEEVAEYRSGEKKLAKRKFFPGYVLVQLPEHPEKNADLWHLIKDTPGVTGFIGSRTEPVPLEDSEVTALVEEIRGERERPRPKLSFEVGERVKINEGAFANFMGNIGEINEERGKVKVMIEIFERQTSVEVDFWQVEKI